VSDHVQVPGLRSVPGDGVLARQGNLVLLSSLADSELVDTLLELLSEIAAAGGNGRRFADVVEDALQGDDTPGAGRGDQPGPAVVAFGPVGAGLAALVCGQAWAEISTVHGTQHLAAGQPSMLLRCTLGSPVIAVRGGLGADRGEAARTDRFSRLDSGAIRAGGLSYYLGHQAVTGAEASGASGRPTAPTAPHGWDERAFQERPPEAAFQARPAEAAGQPGWAGPAAEPETQQVPAAEPGAGPAEPAAAAIEAEPAKVGQPFEAVLLLDEGPGDIDPRPPLPLEQAGQDGAADSALAPIVEGVYCKNGHFDDPEARFCGVCGIAMSQRTLVRRPGPRPPLGVLVLDDGAVFQLDADYVLGREPTLDASVAAGKARPLYITDAAGTISRVHAQVRLQDWHVLVTDLGSANGTRVRLPDGTDEQPLIRLVPALLRPGSQVCLGERGFRYESHRGH